jgi:cell wall-associated NlpC family hydrolase
MSSDVETSPWFFRLPERVAALHAEIETWRDTPFVPGGCVKGEGGGADCAAFDQAVLAAVGAIPPDLNFPRVESDYGPRLHNNKVLDYLRGKVTTGSPPAADPQSALLAKIFAELPRPTKKQISTYRFDYVDPVLMAGDVLVMQADVGMWHMPIMLDHHRFVHCAAPRVAHGDVANPNSHEKIVAVFRARDLGESSWR